MFCLWKCSEVDSFRALIAKMLSGCAALSRTPTREHTNPDLGNGDWGPPSPPSSHILQVRLILRKLTEFYKVTQLIWRWTWG